MSKYLDDIVAEIKAAKNDTEIKLIVAQAMVDSNFDSEVRGEAEKIIGYD